MKKSIYPYSQSSRNSGKLLIILAIFALFGIVGGGFYLFSDSDSSVVSHLQIFPAQQNATEQNVTASIADSGIPNHAQSKSNADGAVVAEGSSEANAASEDDVDNSISQGVINPGETAGVLLKEWMEPNEVHAFIQACNDVFALNKLRAGQPYTVVQDENGLSRFEYEIDDSSKLVVCKLPSDFSATIEPIEYEMALERVKGKIDASLFQSMSDIGESPMLAVKMADIFAWEINFIRDIQPGDSFDLIVEKRFREGEFKGYGKLLAAIFTNKGKDHDAYLYSTKFGDQYFNGEGESLKRQFLKAPLSFTRISSRFTNARLHPIFKTWKAHPAIDYAAPTGTPVKAVGNGVVTFVGRGKGEGNYIKLSHSNGYETMYLHLSKFAAGLKKGNSVSQGQVIGYVGSTGYATGPHLDFRMKKNGSYLNPEVALSPRSEPLAKNQIGEFKKQRDIYRNYFSDEKALAQYGKEAIVE